MIYRFKLYGQRYGIDTKSLTVHKLSELSYDMLRYLTLPFEAAFPSSLRYDLAKYESSQLSEAYLELKKMSEDGVFLSDCPKTVENKPYPEIKAGAEFTVSEKKFVFATDVIKAADAGENAISVKMDDSAPVKESDYDILFADYERVAKEIIKRKTGRIPGKIFDFAPFTLPFTTDEKGYVHIADSSLTAVLEDEKETVEKKLIECAVAVFME